MDIESLPPEVQFAYIATTKCAIMFKEMDYDKKLFLQFCDEIWNSMELTAVDELKSILQDKIKKDLEPYVKEYIKNSKKNERQ